MGDLAKLTQWADGRAKVRAGSERGLVWLRRVVLVSRGEKITGSFFFHYLLAVQQS